MRSGKLRHLLTIQKPSVTQDERGENVTTWTELAAVWGQLTPVSGKEMRTADQVVAETTHTARLRYTPGLTLDTTYRLRYCDRVFAITAPPRNVGELNRELILDLKEHS